MATIVNERDKILQAAAVRFIPPVIPQDQVEGLPGRLDDIESDIGDLGDAIQNLMNTSGNFAIRASALAFKGASGTTVPSSITLTAVKGAGLTGTVNWSVFAGSATLSSTVGDTTSVIGSSVTGASVTVRARLIVSGVIYDAFVTIDRLGAIAAVDKVNLTNQVTGALASGNVSGLGALALLNTVNLNTQTTGALNGQTQVTNLGALAYANAIAANQIGAGQLAAGVVYAGNIFADQIKGGSFEGETFTGGTFSGSRFVSEGSQKRIEMGAFAGPLVGEIAGFYVQGGTSTQTIKISSIGGSYFETTSPSAVPAALTVRSTRRSVPFPTFLVDGHSLFRDTTNTVGPIRLQASTSLPSDRNNGSICYYNGSLCFASDGHWFRCLAEQLT